MPTSTDPAATGPEGVQTLGLLERIQVTAFDEGYREAAGQPWSHRSTSVSKALATIVLVVFAILLTTAGLQTRADAPLQASDRQSLISQINAQKSRLSSLTARAARLQHTVATLTSQGLTSTQAGRAADLQLSLLGIPAGTSVVTGPGVRITVDDSVDAAFTGGRVLDVDLQSLVNGLWTAGAEAVAINNQRITPLSAIRAAGDAITVNFRSLSRPYVVTAIGDPNTLASRFIKSRGGTTWLSLQKVYGLRFEIASAQSLTLPAVSVPTLRYAHPLEVAQ